MASDTTSTDDFDNESFLDAESGDNVEIFQESQDKQRSAVPISESLENLDDTTTSSSTLSLQRLSCNDDHNFMQDSVWRGQKKHIFILSKAGKPIFSLHGNEDKLAELFGIILALVSFVQHGEDAITSIHAKGIKFVFMVTPHLILVAASRTRMSVKQLQLQLR